jgi:hypothetical protein
MSAAQQEDSDMTSPRDNTSTGDAQITGRTVVGLFRDRSRAEGAIRDLKRAGFTSEQIGVATQDRSGRGGDRDEKGEDRKEPGVDQEEMGKIVDETAAGMAEGASVGALTGGVIGSLVGLIGSLLVPGLGPVVVGGVLASTLMGAGLGAATGGLIGALVGMGVPEEEARYFDTGLREGGTLVTVNAGDGTPEALRILQRHEADLGPSRAGRPEREEVLATRYEGQDRRSGHDASYSGPERRLVGV